MENVTIADVAEILNVREKIIKKIPTDIQNSMLALAESVDLATVGENEYQIFRDKLSELWEQGRTYADMKKLSEKAGADFSMLMSLDCRLQQNIYSHYYMDRRIGNQNAVRNAYNNICIAQEIVKPPLIADFLGVPYDELNKYPRKTKVQLCEAYSAQYKENGDNSQLMAELRNVLNNAKPIELSLVAEILNVSIDYFHGYIKEMKEHFCRTYDMLYNDEDNSELIDELKNIILCQRWSEKLSMILARKGIFLSDLLIDN